jgi:hypothetical protein
MNKKILMIFLIAINTDFVFGQWQNLNLDQDILSTFKVGNRIFAGTTSGVYYRLENLPDWTLASGISTKATKFISVDNTLYVSSYEKIYKSTDNGSTWQAMPTVYSFQDINNIAINGNNFIAGMNGNGIYFSADKGISWSSSSTSWQGRNTAIVKKGDIYFSSSESSGYLQRSTNDTGQQWVSPSGNGIKIDLISSFQDIKTLAILNDEVLIAGTNNSATFATYNGVYFSTDDGDNFIKRINGLSNSSINSLTTIGNLIFAGSDGGGVFFSSDEGLNWTSLNSGLTNLTIKNLYSNQSTLFACTSSGLFKIDVCNLLQGNSKIIPNGNIDIPNGNTLELKANLGGINYTWYKDDVIINGVNSYNYIVNQAGNYKVVIEYSSTCNDTSNTVSITLQNLSINENSIDNKINFYPNPVKELIYMKNLTTNSEYKIYNMLGNIVQIGKTNDDKINVNQLARGIYILKLQKDESEVNKKFIKD